MKRIKRSDAMEYEFDHRHAPKLMVSQGESFVVETEDAGSGLIRSTDIAVRLDDLPTRKFDPPKGNPIGGPIYVEGAERGDVLEVEIESIDVDDQGFTALRPGVGPLGDSKMWDSLTGPFVHIIKHLPGPSGTMRDGTGIFNDRVTWDLQPMIGCFGVAPEREILTSSIGQDVTGGNLDIRDVKEGTTIRLNVYHPGGLLFLGDVHASQGDTEYCGGADDAQAELQISCRVVKHKRIPFIQLDLPESIVAVRAGKTLDGMVHKAVEDLINWMVSDCDVTPGMAYTHVSANPDFRINVYQYTVGLAAIGAQIPKKYL